MPVETNAAACDAFRLEIAHMRKALEAQLNDPGSKVDYVPAFSIQVNSSLSSPNQIVMTASITYQFTQS